MTASFTESEQFAEAFPYSPLPWENPPGGRAELYETGTPADAAIALLIDLAQRGEIDPWNVQVIDVIDRCLSELMAIDNSQSRLYEANLSRSGQAFLDASLLVLLKANTLSSLEEPQEVTGADLEAELESDFEDWSDPRLPLHLERQLRRRPAAPPPQCRRVTLPELIEQLRLVAATLQKENLGHRKGVSRSNAQARSSMRAALELAQQESLSDFAAALEQFLTERWANLSQGQDWLELEQLLVLWSEVMAAKSLTAASASLYASTDAEVHHRVGVFWALLLLSAQSKVELVQEEFYQDLKIRALIDNISD